MKNNVIKITLFVIWALCAISILVYWAFNPELSQMEVFIDTWYITLIAFVAIIIFQYKLHHR